MSYEIRQLQDELIEALNSHTGISNEVKRLVLDYVLHLVVKKADEEILNEIGGTDNAEGI